MRPLFKKRDQSMYKVLLGIGCCLILTVAGAKGTEAAEQLSAAILETQADIKLDTETLNQLRQTIDQKRKPLAGRLDTLQKQVAKKRAQLENMRMARRQSEQAQALLQSEVVGLEEECRFVQTLFSEYARATDTRAGTAESIWLENQLQIPKGTLSDGEDFEGLSENVGQLIALSERWRTQRMGGFRFPGVALDAEGIERSGNFAVFGPLAYFSSDDDALAGMAITQFGSALPSVFCSFDPAALKSVSEVVRGSEGVLPIDATEGDAIKIAEARDSLVEHLKKGGFVIWPLLGVGLVSAVLSIWKLLVLSRMKIRDDERIGVILEKVKAGDSAEAETLVQHLSFPLSDLLHEAVEHADAPREHLEEIMHEHVLGTLPKLEAHLGMLAVLGGVAPLLGLLGTVTGMIHTFQLVTLFGSGDAKLLSGGISEALVTTEFGLAIAIPVLLVHAFLARRAHGMIETLEQTAVTIVNDLKIRMTE